LNRLLLATVLLLASAVPADAQLKGAFGVGLGISTVRPRAPELKTVARVRPLVRRVPSHGWGVAMALNWFDADVDASILGASGRLGRMEIRPLMFGVGYTAVRGKVGISPSFVAGPALNTVTVVSGWQDTFTVAGTNFEENVGSISLAARPGVGLTYAIAPRFGAFAFGGYLVNRPAVRFRTPSGEQRVKFRADGFVLNAGLIVSLF
jgi:hypothetical protein